MKNNNFFHFSNLLNTTEKDWDDVKIKNEVKTNSIFDFILFMVIVFVFPIVLILSPFFKIYDFFKYKD